MENSFEFKSPRICHFTFHFRLIFLTFTEVLSERKWGKGGVVGGMLLLLVGCFCLFFCGRVLDKKRLTISLEGDRSYICLVCIFWLLDFVCTAPSSLHRTIPPFAIPSTLPPPPPHHPHYNADAETRGLLEHTHWSEGPLQELLETICLSGAM